MLWDNLLDRLIEIETPGLKGPGKGRLSPVPKTGAPVGG